MAGGSKEHPSFKRHFLPPGEPVKGKTYKADGWAYHSSKWMSRETWNEIFVLAGEGNCIILAMTAKTAQNETLVRGQLLFSPEGQKNILDAKSRDGQQSKPYKTVNLTKRPSSDIL